MKCDIIIPIWGQLEFTRSCIEHIVQNTRYPYRLILIDNASDPETKVYLENLKNKKIAEIQLIRNEENLGFIRAVNQGIKLSNAPYVCILNNDTLPASGWLTELIEFADKHRDIGLLNPLCKGHGERNLTINEYAKEIAYYNKGTYMEMNQCQGFSMLIKREVIEKIGYLDEQFGIGGFDDTDYSMRAYLAGYKSACVYSAYVYHREHTSFDKLGNRKKIQAASEKRFFKKWPRHQRIAIIFSISKNTNNEKITNLLNSALFLAREWCWVNLFIFGDKNTKDRIKSIKEKSNFPLHQNTKFNYLNSKFQILEIALRIIERSFGTKKRKKYNAVIYNDIKLTSLLKVLCGFQRCTLLRADFNNFPEKVLKNVVTPFAKCDIILPIYNQYESAKKCIESILENTDTPYRLIIINNGKNPKIKELLNELEHNNSVESTVVHNAHNIGWVKSLNKGIELSDAPYVCFQNDDTVVTRGWLGKMIGILQLQENFGMVNPTWESRLERNNKKFVETDWCRGFSVVIKREVINKIGTLDENFGIGYFDDVDYSVRAIEAGFLCLRALNTYVYHERNVTASLVFGEKWDEFHEKNKLIYYKKWGRPLKIVMILDKKTYKDKKAVEKIEETAFCLARKQHHIDIWAPSKLVNRFQHTNIKLKSHFSLFLRILAFFDLYMNKKKRKEKRYDAVFRLDSIKEKDPCRFIIETTDRLKEKTKPA